MDDRFFLNRRDFEGIQKLLREWRAGFPWLRNRLRRRGGNTAGGGTKIRQAQIAEVAPAADHVKGSLLNESTGVAVTDGVFFELDIYARISNGVRLDRASPKIQIGDIYPVYQSKYNNNGTPESRWYFVQNFQGAEVYIGENE